jgi:hypothetical protein
MRHALLLLALSSCVTTARIVKQGEVGTPLLIGAIAADILVTSVAVSQIQSYSVGSSIAIGLVLTGVDGVLDYLLRTWAVAALRL